MPDQRPARGRAVPLVLCVLLMVCLCYQAYRYPFQINSALTSPTYSNTPAWLQFGKWALIAALAASLALFTARTLRSSLPRMPRVRLVALGVEVLLVGSALVRLAAGAASIEPLVLLVLAGTALLVTLAPPVDARANTFIVRILVAFAIVCVVVELAQVLLYLLADRLPALAYENSPSVRFGSLLDDPNGFAVLLALLIPVSWVALRPRPNLRLVVAVALLCCLPLSQSWTGVTATVTALSVTYLTAHGLRRDLRRAAGLVVTAAAVTGVAAYFARSTIAELIRLKQGSAEEHAASFAHIAPAPEPSRSATPSLSPSASSGASHAVVGSIGPGDAVAAPDPVAAATWTHGIESGFVNLYVNYGPVLLAAYVALGVLAVVVLLRGRTRLPLALRVGSASYLICFLLASANLGLDRTFPCNALYFFFCGLALATSVPSRGRSSSSGNPRRTARAETERPMLQPDCAEQETSGRDLSGPDRGLVLRRQARLEGPRTPQGRSPLTSPHIARDRIEGIRS